MHVCQCVSTALCGASGRGQAEPADELRGIMLGRDELQEPQAHRDQRRLVTHSTISHNKRGACCTQVQGGAAVVMSGRRAVRREGPHGRAAVPHRCSPSLQGLHVVARDAGQLLASSAGTSSSCKRSDMFATSSRRCRHRRRREPESRLSKACMRSGIYSYAGDVNSVFRRLRHRLHGLPVSFPRSCLGMSPPGAPSSPEPVLVSFAVFTISIESDTRQDRKLHALGAGAAANDT